MRAPPGRRDVHTPRQHHIVALDRETPYERYVLKFSVGFVPEHVIDRFGPDVDFFRANDRVRELMVGLDELYEKFYGFDLYTLINCRINEITVCSAATPPSTRASRATSWSPT